MQGLAKVEPSVNAPLPHFNQFLKKINLWDTILLCRIRSQEIVQNEKIFAICIIISLKFHRNIPALMSLISRKIY